MYESANLAGYASRALREDEFHRKAQELGCAFGCEISWAPIPALLETDENDDDYKVAVVSWPLLLPSSLAARAGISLTLFLALLGEF